MSRVTFIIPAYNVEKYLPEALDAVIAQSETDWKLIIADDCSSDDTAAIAKEYARRDNRIRVIRMKTQSGGAYLPREYAIREADTEFVAPLDADDSIGPDYLRNLLSAQARNDADIVYPVMYRWDGTISHLIESINPELIGKTLPGKDCVKFTLDRWQIHCNGGLIRRGLYLKAFDEIDIDGFYGIRSYIDEYMTRVLLYNAGKVSICNEPYYYRDNQDSVTYQFNFKAYGRLTNNLRLLSFIGEHYPKDSDTYTAEQIHNFHTIFDAMRLLRVTRLSKEEYEAVRECIIKCEKGADLRLLRGKVSRKYLLLSYLPYGLRRRALNLIDRMLGIKRI